MRRGCRPWANPSSSGAPRTRTRVPTVPKSGGYSAATTPSLRSVLKSTMPLWSASKNSTAVLQAAVRASSRSNEDWMASVYS